MKKTTTTEMEQYILSQFNEEENNKIKKTYLTRHYKLVAKELEKLGVISPNDVSKEIVEKLINIKIQSIFQETEYHNQYDIKRINMYIDFVNFVFGFDISPKETDLYSCKAICPKCGKEMQYVETDKFSRYVCKSCDITQGILKGSNFPSGSPANKKVRELRKRIFSALNELFPTNPSKKYPFIARIVGKKNNRMDNMIAYLDETECNHVLNAINFVLKQKKFLMELKPSNPISYKLATYFFVKKAGIEEFRWLWLAQNKVRAKMESTGLIFYKMDEISRIMKVTPNEAVEKLWEIYGYGAPIKMNAHFIDGIIKDNKELLDALHYETIEELCEKLVRRNYFPNLNPQEIFKIVARYHRIKLAMEFKNMPIEEFDEKYSF